MSSVLDDSDLSVCFTGGASDTVSFTTNICEPDQPSPPKLIQRAKTSISLRWNAPADNGAHIQQYILESDDGKSSTNHFVEVFKGRSKTFNVTKLQSATTYRFRLTAVSVCFDYPRAWRTER